MVLMSEISRYCAAIGTAFKPRRIILFGSHARGNPQADSDVDLLVVMPKSRKLRRDLAVCIRLEVSASFPVDLLVREESEMERRVREKDLFVTQIFSEGRVMFEAVNA